MSPSVLRRSCHTGGYRASCPTCVAALHAVNQATLHRTGTPIRAAA